MIGVLVMFDLIPPLEITLALIVIGIPTWVLGFIIGVCCNKVFGFVS